MSYKTILVHVDRSQACKQRIEIAATLSCEQNAHLVGVAPTGVSSYIYQISMGSAVPAVAQLDTYIDELREAARKELDRFEECVKGMLVPSYESLLEDEEATAGVALRGHYSDLVVVGQFDPDSPNLSTTPYFAEDVAEASGRPVLVLPNAGPVDSVARRALVAWDAGPQATRAVTGAIPLLRNADTVDVVVFNTKANREAHGEQPGADIGLYLARHDVKVNVITGQPGSDLGNALLSLAADRNSDLLVMGCYGHSRFRELLAGGVTRTVMASMTLPVLMAH